MKKKISPDLHFSLDKITSRIFFDALSILSEGICILDENCRLFFINPAMEKIFSIPRSSKGMLLSEMGLPIKISQHIQQQVTGVLKTGKPVKQKISFTTASGTVQSIEFSWQKMEPYENEVLLVLGQCIKLKPGKEIEKEAEINLYDTNGEPDAVELWAMLESISDGVYIGNNEGISLANQAALDQLGFKTKTDLNRNIATLANEINTRDAATGEFIPADKQAFSRALSGESVVQNVMVRHRITGEEVVIRCAASPVFRNNKIIAAIAVNTNITRQQNAENELRESRERKKFLLSLTDAIRQLSDPILIQQTTTQLLGKYLNVDRCYYAWMDSGRKIICIERDYTSDKCQSLAGEFDYDKLRLPVEIISKGKTFISEDTYSIPELQEQLENYRSADLAAMIATPLIKDGRLVASMAIASATPRHWTKSEIQLLDETADRTWAAVERAGAEVALRESELQFRSFVAASSELVYKISADWKKMHTISNRLTIKNNNLENENWLNLYVPKVDRRRVWTAIQAAVKDQKMFQLEHKIIKANGSIGWAHSRAIPVFDEKAEIKEWFGAASDITRRKNAEEQLQKLMGRLEEEVSKRTSQLKVSRDRLQSIFDTTMMQISILEAIRGEDNEILDLRIKLANKELERETGRNDLEGKLYAEEFPGIRETKLFELIVNTIETGKSNRLEYYYPYEGFNKWFSSMFVKLNDGVVATNMDITASKRDEEERIKNLTLLQQSEDLASLGSWDYDLHKGIFSWSDGMYRLFNLAKGTEVSPEIYLNFSTKQSMPAAERIVKHIRKGDCDFMESLELDIGGKIKILHLKASVIKNQNGNPVRVLGVDMDVTASRLADEKIREIEATRQQEIFRVTLASQEEERRRISESLHNGLGQTLYAIKISMTQLTEKKAVQDAQAFRSSKKYTEDLLTLAIAESRRISHELMPSVLEDFGLKAAIDDVCKQLNSEVTFSCKFNGLQKRLDKYMELAVFRIIQELMLNVVKHAKANKADVELTITPIQVSITVGDNGKGIAKENFEKKGIGLASIKSRMKLLNGKVYVNSDENSGTKVKVIMPVSIPNNEDSKK